MARCNSCNGIITKTDLDCYICGDPVPGAKRAKFAFLRFLTAAPVKPAKRTAQEPERPKRLLTV
jgi:hypothetical protein